MMPDQERRRTTWPPASPGLKRKMPGIMRIMIQNKETGLYLRRLDEWVERPERAFEFCDTTSACQFCTALGVTGVHIVLKFGAGFPDLVMALDSPSASPPILQSRS
jgi:hypothetical protein